ncbi:MAG: PDZ domain-containing protein, partial [Nitrospinota bacterium]|nr:PDZ domain-containing protein [Nitrospinota bacterium]
FFDIPSGIGVQVDDLVDKQTEVKGLQTDEGVVVAEITPNSRGERAGLERDDLITAINGKKIRSRKQFEKIVREIRPQEQVFLLVFRNKKAIRLTLPSEG